MTNMTQSPGIPKPHEMRPRPIALAHAIVSTRVDSMRMIALNALFAKLSWAEALQCRAEIVRCKQAKREQSLASVKDKL